MPQCCTDPSAMWLDDFEDGQPLSNRYVPVIANAAVTAGAGINGSSGVRATGPYGQFETPSLQSLKTAGVGIGTLPCVDPLAFGAGGYWKFDDFQQSGFYFLEIRAGVFTLLSFGVVESAGRSANTFPLDICVIDVSFQEIYLAKNVIKNATDFYNLI